MRAALSPTRVLAFALLATPFALAAQTVLTDDYNDGTIQEVTDGTVSTLLTGVGGGTFNGQQMSLGYGGYVYVAEDGGNNVYRFTTSGTNLSTFATGVASTLTGITYDASTNTMWLADYGAHTVYAIDATGTLIANTTANVGNNPGALTSDGAGHVFVASGSGIQEITESNPTAAVTNIESGGTVTDIVYSGGNLYTTDSLNGGINEYSLAGSLVNSWTTGGNPTEGISVDAAGDIFAASGNAGFLYEVAPGLGSGSATVVTSDLSTGFVNGIVAVSAVPEPSAYAAALGIAALGLAFVRRQRRQIA